jgi:hypothetical protein
MILKLRQLQIQLDVEFFFKSKLRLQLEQNYSSIVNAISDLELPPFIFD